MRDALVPDAGEERQTSSLAALKPSGVQHRILVVNALYRVVDKSNTSLW